MPPTRIGYKLAHSPSYYASLRRNLSATSFRSNEEKIETTQTGKQRTVLLNGGPPTSRIQFRRYTTSDGKRVIGAYAVYEDVIDQLPKILNRGLPCAPSTRPYEVREIDGKGRGMIATRDIRKGETIVFEHPKLMVPVGCLSNDSGRQMEIILLQLVYWLEQEDREKILRLHHCRPFTECGPFVGLVQTNSVHAGFRSKVEMDYACVCLEISYANHSCTPNAKYARDIKTLLFYLNATKDISKGDEICISYIDATQPLATRQAEVRQKYNFTCACPLCTSPIEAAREEKRLEFAETISSFYFSWLAILNAPQHERNAMVKEELEEIHRVMRCMDEEGWLADRRGEVLQYVAFMYAAQGDVENFKKFGKLFMEWSEKGEGHSTDVAMDRGKKSAGVNVKLKEMWDEWLARPESMPFWGKFSN